MGQGGACGTADGVRVRVCVCVAKPATKPALPSPARAGARAAAALPAASESLTTRTHASTPARTHMHTAQPPPALQHGPAASPQSPGRQTRRAGSRCACLSSNQGRRRRGDPAACRRTVERLQVREQAAVGQGCVGRSRRSHEGSSRARARRCLQQQAIPDTQRCKWWTSKGGRHFTPHVGLAPTRRRVLARPPAGQPAPAPAPAAHQSWPGPRRSPWGTATWPRAAAQP